VAAGLLLCGGMIPLTLACGGPMSATDGVMVLLVILAFGAVWFAKVLALIAAGFLVSVRAYQQRSAGLALIGAGIGGIHLLLGHGLPVSLITGFGCLAIAAAAAARSQVHTA